MQKNKGEEMLAEIGVEGRLKQRRLYLYLDDEMCHLENEEG
jgi:hypothetical protein